MDEIGEFQRVADEEDRRVVADQVVVAVIGVELDREAARVTDRLRRPLPPATVEKRTNTSVRLPTRLKTLALVYVDMSLVTSKYP